VLLARFFQAVFILSLLGILLVLFQAGATSAGQVIFSQDYRAPGSNQAITFDRPETLKVLQSNLQAGRPDYYTFQGRPEVILKVKLDTLRLVGQDNFQPSLALFGPGLPPPTPDEVNLFPYSLPPGDGLLISSGSGQPAGTGPTRPPATRFDEPWTQAGYWERQSILNPLPQNGSYFLVVYSLDNQSGKYALFVGDKPEVGLRETLTFPITWARVHYWFDDLWWPTFALTLVGLALLALVYLYGRSVWRQYRVTQLANRNRRRAGLLKKKTHHAWQARRISRKPARQARPASIIRALPFTHSAHHAGGKISPAIQGASQGSAAQNGGGPVNQAAIGGEPALPAEPAFRWEPIAPPQVDNLAVTQDSNELEAKNGETEAGEVASVKDGLAVWGRRFRP
jgi:hypothetical protein